MLFFPDRIKSSTTKEKEYREDLSNKFLEKNSKKIIAISAMLIFLIPYIIILLFTSWEKSVYITILSHLLISLTTFYLNYFIFVKYFIIKRRKLLFFILTNYIWCICITFIQWIIFKLFPNIDFHLLKDFENFHSVFFWLTNNLPMVFMMALLAIALKMTNEWYITEKEKSELKSAASQAEIQNLKNQLNPHFLFNTLNNIYILIDHDNEKAKKSILELSKLLRYVLENNQDKIPLSKELTFTRSYIELMALRVIDNVHIRVDITDRGIGLTIAPLLFVTLIENAFKHGVSQETESFIDIDIQLDENTIKAIIQNSFFPKKENDYSGSGIGITNLKKRLALLYPKKHTYEIKLLNNVYIATLTIQLD